MDATAAVILASISIVVTVGNFIYRINFDTQSQRRKNALDFMAKIASDVYLYRTAHVDQDINFENVVFHSKEAINPYTIANDKLIDHKAELAKYIAKRSDMVSNVLKSQAALISDRYIMAAIFSGDVSRAREALINLTFYEKDDSDNSDAQLTDEKANPYKQIDDLIYDVLDQVYKLFERNNRHSWNEESLRYGMEESFPMPEKPKG